ncbi:hypothetical protein [Occallatibacter riparius]|uniref:Uncharacterized protein n=1 Tax=Occallatibacter riparius TaxID=1002689 RepID=A0A9J7BIV6_9BACT|nr:hypothetical protein [Occallatibacter riparius]UWZ82615.1 hypothetical protein MOP44_18835 [Occallatibacter riparius]
MRSLFMVVPIFLSFGLMAGSAASQTSAGSPKATRPTPGEIKAFLRQPGGLEKLTAKFGDVEFTNQNESWGQDSLDSLARRSNLIVIASVTSKASQLTPDGNRIETTFNLDIKQSLKGTNASQIAVTAEGGHVAFSNGHVATLHGDLSDSLAVGARYIFFLSRADGRLVPTVGSAGALSITPEDTVQLVGQREYPDDKLAGELSGLSLAAVTETISNYVK